MIFNASQDYNNLIYRLNENMTIKTLSDYLRETDQNSQLIDLQLVKLIETIANTTIRISQNIRQGALAGLLGSAGSQNIQGEIQQTLDIYANQAILSDCESIGILAGMASEEMDEFYAIFDSLQKGRYLLLFDPLDGSSNIAINSSIGSIFSILVKSDPNTLLNNDDFLQPGHRQIAACYALYGPQTFFALTIGQGVVGFTLNAHTNRFMLTHPTIKIPKSATEFAINMSNQRYWEKPVQNYISELLNGQSGAREKNFNMRWIASMVADVHRILMRGGIFAYPKDNRNPNQLGKLRLLYEANPMAFLIEQAGGLACDGQYSLLEIQPTSLHQRVAVFLGAQEEIELIMRYHHAN
jgi:fructose-1,6-bisphosphatase I